MTENEKSGRVSVDHGALTMVLNALRRDAEEGKQARGEMADALESSTSSALGGEQVPFMYAIADGYGNPFFEEQGCVSSEAKDLQPEVDSLNQDLDGEPPYKVVALYTHPTQQGLNAAKFNRLELEIRGITKMLPEKFDCSAVWAAFEAAQAKQEGNAS